MTAAIATATATATAECAHCRKGIRQDSKGYWGARKRDDPHPWYCDAGPGAGKRHEPEGAAAVTAKSPLAEAAAAVRKDIKAAVNADTLPPHPEGITFRVRSARASLMASVDIEILHVPHKWAYTGGGLAVSRPAPALMVLKDALRRIAARHWEADGNVTFIEVQVDGETMTDKPAA